jgi:hypothetical protein
MSIVIHGFVGNFYSFKQCLSNKKKNSKQKMQQQQPYESRASQYWHQIFTAANFLTFLKMKF